MWQNEINVFIGLDCFELVLVARILIVGNKVKMTDSISMLMVATVNFSDQRLIF